MGHWSGCDFCRALVRLAPVPTCLCSSTLKELVFHTDSWVLGHPSGGYIKIHKNPYLRNVASKVKQIKQLVLWLQMHFFLWSPCDYLIWTHESFELIHSFTNIWNEEYPTVKSVISGESFRINSQEVVEQVGGKEGNQLEVGIYRLCLSWKSKWSQDPETFKSKQLIREAALRSRWEDNMHLLWTQWFWGACKLSSHNSVSNCFGNICLGDGWQWGKFCRKRTDLWGQP